MLTFSLYQYLENKITYRFEFLRCVQTVRPTIIILKIGHTTKLLSLGNNLRYTIETAQIIMNDFDQSDTTELLFKTKSDGFKCEIDKYRIFVEKLISQNANTEHIKITSGKALFVCQKFTELLNNQPTEYLQAHSDYFLSQF